MGIGEARKQWSAGRIIDGGISGEEVDNAHEMGNYEKEEEKQSGNVLWGSQSAGSQYKLAQGDGRYSSGRSETIIEREMPGARREIPKGETGNCYGDSAWRMGEKALGEHDTFAIVTKDDVPEDEVRINGRFACYIKHKSLKGGHVKAEEYIDN